MLKSVHSSDNMTEHSVTFSPDTNIFTVIHELLVHKISGATVVDGENRILRVISQGDCLKAILDGTYNHGYANGSVDQVMTTKVDTVSPDLDIIDVARTLLTKIKRTTTRCRKWQIHWSDQYSKYFASSKRL